MNFTHLTNPDNASQISYLDFKRYPEMVKLHEDNIRKTINKLPSSLKTKAISLMLSKGVLSIGYGATNMKNSTVPIYEVTMTEGNALRKIMVDLSKVVQPGYLDEFLRKIDIVKRQQEIININSGTLTSTSTLQIDMAKETIIKTLTDVIENINYYTLVDIYYYGYLKFLTKISLQRNKQKVFGQLNTIITGTFKNIIVKYSKRDLSQAEKNLITLVTDFLMISQFSDNPAQTTLNNMKKFIQKNYTQKLTGPEKNQEPNLETISDWYILKLDSLGLTKYEKIEDISYILAALKIVNLTPNALIKLLQQEFGEAYPSFNHHIDTLIAYICSGQYKTELFGQRKNFKEQIQILEELITNAKGQITYKPF